MRLQVESEEARGAEDDGGGRERQAKRRAERGGGGRHLAAHHRVRTHAHARLSSRQKKECRNAQKTRGAWRVRRWDG